MVNLLANSCFHTHPAVVEQHYHSCKISSADKFNVPPALTPREISGSLVAK